MVPIKASRLFIYLLILYFIKVSKITKTNSLNIVNVLLKHQMTPQKQRGKISDREKNYHKKNWRISEIRYQFWQFQILLILITFRILLGSDFPLHIIEDIYLDFFPSNFYCLL